MFEQKRIIDELEGSLTESPIDANNTEVTQVAVETNDDEDITASSKVRKIKEFSDDMEIYLKE